MYYQNFQHFSYLLFFLKRRLYEINYPVMVRLFRGPLLVVLFLFLLGINIYGWGKAGVNHVLIFELDPRNHLSYQQLMELGAIFGVVWTAHLLIFLFGEFINIPTFAVPLSLNLTMLIFMLNPTHTLMHGARFWLLKFVGRIFAAPFLPVAFADFWLADQMNSMATAFTDFHYLTCFYTTSNATVNSKFYLLDIFIIRLHSYFSKGHQKTQMSLWLSVNEVASFY